MSFNPSLPPCTKPCCSVFTLPPSVSAYVIKVWPLLQKLFSWWRISLIYPESNFCLKWVAWPGCKVQLKRILIHPTHQESNVEHNELNRRIGRVIEAAVFLGVIQIVCSLKFPDFNPPPYVRHCSFWLHPSPCKRSFSPSPPPPRGIFGACETSETHFLYIETIENANVHLGGEYPPPP